MFIAVEIDDKIMSLYMKVVTPYFLNSFLNSRGSLVLERKAILNQTNNKNNPEQE